MSPSTIKTIIRPVRQNALGGPYSSDPPPLTPPQVRRQNAYGGPYSPDPPPLTPPQIRRQNAYGGPFSPPLPDFSEESSDN